MGMVPNINLEYEFEDFEPYPGLKRICERRVNILEHHIFKKPEGWTLKIRFSKRGDLTHLSLHLQSRQKSIEAESSDLDDYFAIYNAFNILKDKLFHFNDAPELPVKGPKALAADQVR